MGKHRLSLQVSRPHPFSNNFSLMPPPRHRFVRLVLGLTAAALMGLGSSANAQDRIWSDTFEAPLRPAKYPPIPGKHHRPAKSQGTGKEIRKPKGPLIIAISIDRQTLKIYDADGFFAETPVSTGMRGHSTPLGVFSVIQKQKWHRSNIYSDAPMPFMQRITWSGIAMHAGVLPGYPASHGCIRMPMSFAMKMFGWTRMGARVIIAPGEVTPTDFSHPMLMTHRPEPLAVASADAQSSSAQTGNDDKSTTQTMAMQVAAARDLRLTTRTEKPSAGATGASATGASGIRTADASGAMPQLTAPSSSLDSASTASVERLPAAAAAVSFDAPQLRTAIGIESKISEPAPSATASSPAVPTSVLAKTDKAGDDIKAGVADALAASVAAAKDQLQLSAAQKSGTISELVERPAPKRSGRPLAVFVSGKDNKIYVRQNFEPLFDAPVTIAASDRPLGTHVFTAEADKDNNKNFHWSVISLPATYRTERVSTPGSSSHRQTVDTQAELKPVLVPDRPADALNRIAIPGDVMTRIAESLSPGSSFVISDQGVGGGETGEGTDFIVTLR